MRPSSGASSSEDPLVGRVGVLLVGDVGGLAQQLGAALAQRAGPPRRSRAVGFALGAGAGRSPCSPSDDVGQLEQPPRVFARVRSDLAEQIGGRLAPCGGPQDLRAGAQRGGERPLGRAQPGAGGDAHEPGRGGEDRRDVQAFARTVAVGGRRRLPCLWWGSSEDRQVQQARAEAEHGAVQDQQPLIFAHPGAQHLREVAGGHLAHARARSARAPPRSGGG